MSDHVTTAGQASRSELLLVARARVLAKSGRGREVRVKADLSVREVAQACGASSSAVWRWEMAQRVPRGPAAAAWARLITDIEGTTAA